MIDEPDSNCSLYLEVRIGEYKCHNCEEGYTYFEGLCKHLIIDPNCYDNPGKNRGWYISEYDEDLDKLKTKCLMCKQNY